MQSLEAFRQETRAWLEKNCPASMRTPMPEDEKPWGGRHPVWKNPDSKIWMDRMAARGWTAPVWPKAYGGGGLNAEENQILQEELRRIQARPALVNFGIYMLGGALMEFGTEEQKQRFLPSTVRGEIRWCQGYSEPGAGSDLAGLQTKAEDKGDHFLVNGQKIWTSQADKADWIFCLVRTDTTRKHDGISFLLFDMKTPGVEARPIRLISGASVFCETFFTDVKVPKKNLVGELNKGWTVAKRLLEFERGTMSSIFRPDAAGGTESRLEDLAKKYVGDKEGRIASPILRDRVAQHNMDDQAFALSVQRAANEKASGQDTGALTPTFKYAVTELNKRRHELMLDIMGLQGLGWEGEGFSESELTFTREWLRSKGNSIEGGASEIQLNIVAKRVLGLPD